MAYLWTGGALAGASPLARALRPALRSYPERPSVEEAVSQLEGAGPGEELVLVGAEPTSRDDLPRLVAAALARRPGSAVRIVTDGARCADGGYAASLVASGASRFTVRLFGPDPEVHDAETQVRGSFEAAVAGVRSLVAIGAWVEVSLVASRAALPRIPEAARFVANELAGVSRVTIENPRWGDGALARGTAAKAHPHEAFPLVDMAHDIVAHHDIPVRLEGFPFDVLSSKAPYPLADASLSPWPIGMALEVIAIEEGLKPAARVSLEPGREGGLGALCRRRGLSLERAAFRHRLGPNELSRRVEGSDPRGSRIYFYIAPEPRAARAARDADAAGDDYALGEALGYPACCRAFYAGALAGGGHPDLAALALEGSTPGPHPFELNVLSTYVPGLVSHAPHSLSCEPSLAAARGLLASLRAREPLLATAIERSLRCHVLYASRASRVSIWGRRRGDRVDVDDLVPFGDAIRPGLGDVDEAALEGGAALLLSKGREVARLLAPPGGRPFLATFSGGA